MLDRCEMDSQRVHADEDENREHRTGTVLLFRAHHAIADGVFMSNLLLKQLLRASELQEGEEDRFCPTECECQGHPEIYPSDNSVPSVSTDPEAVRTASSRSKVQESGILSTVWQGIVKSIRFVVEMPLSIGTKTLWEKDDVNSFHLYSLSGKKRVCWSRSIPLNTVKRIKNHFRCELITDFL